MKKYIIPVLFALVPYISSKAQSTLYGLPFDERTKKITFEKVFNVDGMNKNEIYKKAKEWLVPKYFNSGSPVILDDENEGKIIVLGHNVIRYRARFLIFWNTKNFNMLYKLKVSTKENKYKIVLTDFVIQENISGHSSSFSTVNWGVYGVYVTGFTSYKAPEVRNYPVERFFLHKYRRNKFGLAWDDFQSSVDKIMNEAEKMINLEDENW